MSSSNAGGATSEGTATTEPSSGGTASETAAPDGTTLDGSTIADDTSPAAGCGNGFVEPDEQCDGDDLAEATCLNVLGYGGELSCTKACTFDVTDCFPPGMILIPSGSFEMGSDAYSDDERPARKVDVDAFYIDATEVTVDDYAGCVSAFECGVPQAGGSCNWSVPGRDDHPINCVSWNDAAAYCAWAGGMNHKRLPTEAEWEKAARGDDARLYPWGDEPPPTCTHAVMDQGGGGGCGSLASYPVGSKPLGDSPYGVHDMAGNTWNWVADWYGVYDLAETHNPLGPPTGIYHVVRGGSWDTEDIVWFRTSARGPVSAAAHRSIGFRCARDLRPPQ